MRIGVTVVWHSHRHTCSTARAGRFTRENKPCRRPANIPPAVREAPAFTPERMSLNSRSSQTITVTVSGVYLDDSSGNLEIEFRTIEGLQSKAVLDVGYNSADSEAFEFIQSADVSADNVSQILNQSVEINLAKFPQFYHACDVPPAGVAISAANHPEVVQKTKEFEKSDNPSMEELLYERIRLLNGVTDTEAKKMANTEALNMGEIEALNTNISKDTVNKEQNGI